MNSEGKKEKDNKSINNEANDSKSNTIKEASAYTAEVDTQMAYKRFLEMGVGRHICSIVDPTVSIGYFDKNAELVYTEQFLEMIKTYLSNNKYNELKDSNMPGDVSYTFFSVDG